MKRKKQKY